MQTDARTYIRWFILAYTLDSMFNVFLVSSNTIIASRPLHHRTPHEFRIERFQLVFKAKARVNALSVHPKS